MRMGKIEETHQRIQDTAIELFTKHGFDNVTVEEVARAAGVSHMTFFRHFPTKESVVFDDPYDPVIGQMIAAQDRSAPALQRVGRGLLAAWALLDEPDTEMTRNRVRLAAGHPGLRAKVWENNHRTEDIIVAALVDDDVDEFEARVAAGAVMGAIMAALLYWGPNSDAGSLGDCVRNAIGLLMTDGAQL